MMSEDTSPFGERALLQSEPLASKYLQYLPAIYADPRESGPFVGQFLVPFEAEFEGLRDLLAEIDHFFSPALTSTTPDFLTWLAGWVALTLDETWDTAKRRQIIAEAVTLYRLRGTVKGLERFLEIYTGYVPVIRDGLWPGGFQIGVASRLPVLDGSPTGADEGGGSNSPQSPLDARLADVRLVDGIDAVERREPSKYDDYYVVRAGAGADVGEEDGQREVYYRADKVAEVKTGKDAATPAGAPGVVVRLTDGREHVYSPASIIRQDQVIDECYTLTQRGQVTVYRGDAYLIAMTPLPYRFTVDLALPCVPWRYRFEALPLVFEERPPPADLPPEELERRRAEFLTRLHEAQAERAGQLAAVLGDLAAGRWPEMLWDDFERHGITLPANPVVVQPEVGNDTAGGSAPFQGNGQAAGSGRPSIGWSVTDSTGQVFVVALRGDILKVYEWASRSDGSRSDGACREWLQARRPDYVRRIRAIIDEVKPAHTIYTLRVSPQVAPAAAAGSRFQVAGSGFPVQPPSSNLQSATCNLQLDLDFRIGVESVIC